MSGLLARWRFAFTRRWFTYLTMAIAFAIACGFLSHWQFGRNAQTVAANSLLQQNYGMPAVSVSSLLPTKSYYSTSVEWRKALLVGRYLPSKQILVRDRSRDSNDGFDVLTPFRLTDGSIFIVDRGWVEVGTRISTSVPQYIPAPPGGLVRAIVHIRPSEQVIPGRSAPRGQIEEINPRTVAKMDGLTDVYVGTYGTLSSETPAPAQRPLRAPKPTIDNGPFLSYAIQWILFALMGFGGLAWALRAEYRLQNADDPLVREQAAARDRRAAARPPTDAQIEDAQIAAAAAATAAATAAAAPPDLAPDLETSRPQSR